MRCWAQPPNSTSPALSKNALSHVRKSKRAAEADWKLVLQWGRSLNREGCTSALSFHPDLGAFGLVSTRVLPQGVKEARLAAAMKRYRTGGHSCNGCPLPGFHLTPHWPAAIGATVHMRHERTSGSSYQCAMGICSKRPFIFVHAFQK